MVSAYDSKKGITYAGQEKLKKLPIPKLEDTIPRYLSAVKQFMVSFCTVSIPFASS